MMETLQEIIKHYQSKNIAKPKIVVWAHNSHLGNAKATQMSTYGEFNIWAIGKRKIWGK